MRRLRDEYGFMLIEIAVVVVITGCLVAIAVPAYLSFTGSAQTAGEKSNVRLTIPAAEQMSNANENYAGISGAALRSTTPGIGTAVKAVAVHSNLGYCVPGHRERRFDLLLLRRWRPRLRRPARVQQRHNPARNVPAGRRRRGELAIVKRRPTAPPFARTFADLVVSSKSS